MLFQAYKISVFHTKITWYVQLNFVLNFAGEISYYLCMPLSVQDFTYVTREKYKQASALLIRITS